MTADHYNKLTWENIRECEEGFRARVIDWLGACQVKGVHPYIYEGYREPQRQNAYYAKGRTQPGKIITGAAAFQSYHQFRLAIDWVPIVYGGSGGWDVAWKRNDLYQRAQKIATKFDLVWLSWETPHLQDGRWGHWTDLQEAFGKPDDGVWDAESATPHIAKMATPKRTAHRPDPQVMKEVAANYNYIKKEPVSRSSRRRRRTGTKGGRR